ncbi:TetR family transcriptional regulator [Streptomyces sp. CB02923]|uniref:TetR/AcrR family transcriptional regulator C-terminal domain-containing protein n=1 Tax=Streptomyces sp. CB02923 TaxID=1718985 RepID=UPI00093EE719|nr:TetR/AcrR family transcriptional regulator C-terminal domain-containing protein [Streptomyces sp. CB02923]OKI09864.1 TetR family transcriptional regulator [Streptomyces sp. CB02923]
MATRLDRKLVAETALRLLNDVGLEGLTLRRIAKELDVQAPALYWHFKNKQELLDEMATALLRRMTEPAAEAGDGHGGGDWRAMLTESCRQTRHTLLGYRDGGKVFGGTRLGDQSLLRPMESLLAAMGDAGFTPERAARAWFTTYAYTIGYVIEEQSVFPVPGDPRRDPAYDQEERMRSVGADYPLTAAAGAEMFGNIADGFDDGLRAVIAGIEATLLHGR